MYIIITDSEEVKKILGSKIPAGRRCPQVSSSPQGGRTSDQNRPEVPATKSRPDEILDNLFRDWKGTDMKRIITLIIIVSIIGLAAGYFLFAKVGGS